MTEVAKSRWRWRGRVRIVARHVDGTVEVDEFDNAIHDAGLDLLAQALTGAVSTPEIRYIALGASDAAIDTSDTTLGDERFRKPVSLQSNPSTGEAVTTVYIAPHEAVDFTIEEIGWFAGPDATDDPDSGVLIARVLYSRAKTNLESLQIQRVDTFAEEGA